MRAVAFKKIRLLLMMFLNIAVIDAMGQSDGSLFRGGDARLRRTIDSLIAKSPPNYSKNTFHLIAATIERGEIKPVTTFSKDTTEGYTDLQRIILSTSGQWLESAEAHVLLFPFFLYHTKDEGPVEIKRWELSNDLYQRKNTMLLSPITLLIGWDPIR